VTGEKKKEKKKERESKGEGGYLRRSCDGIVRISRAREETNSDLEDVQGVRPGRACTSP